MLLTKTILKSCDRLSDWQIVRERHRRMKRIPNAPVACPMVRHYDARLKCPQEGSTMWRHRLTQSTILETNSSEFGLVRQTIINAFSKRITHKNNRNIHLIKRWPNQRKLHLISIKVRWLNANGPTHPFQDMPTLSLKRNLNLDNEENNR